MYLINSDYKLSVKQNNLPCKNGVDKNLPFKALVPKNRESSKVNSEHIKAYFGADNTTVVSQKDKKPLTKEELSDYKDDMGRERFDDKEKEELILLSKSCPLIRNLIKLETTTGKPRFTVKDINYLADLHEVHPESVTELALIETSRHEPRFDASDIDELLVNYELYPNEITALAKMETEYGEPRFANYDIMNLTSAYYNNPDEVRELAKIKTSKGMPKFKGYEISSLAKIYENHKDAIIDLAKMISSQGDDRFNGEDIEDLAESYEQHPETVKALAEIEGKDKLLRFDGEDIRILIPTFEKHPDAVKELADLRTSKNAFRFSSIAIESLAESYEKYPEVIISLAYAETDNGRPKFTTDDIRIIADLCKNKELEKIVTDKSDKIQSCKNTSSYNFIELETDDKLFHIQVTSDGGYKLIGVETQRSKIDTQTTVLKMADGTEKQESYGKKWSKEWQGYLEKVKDKDGNVRITLTKPSKKNPGVLIIKEQIWDKDDNLIEYKDTGIVKNYGEKGERRKIERNFVSPLGVKSSQLILEVPRGKRSQYKTGDFVCNRVLKKIDENTTETCAWGNKYITRYKSDNSIEISVLRKDGTNSVAVFNSEQADRELMPLMRQLPGDFIYNLAKNRIKVLITHDKSLKNNACFYHDKILVSPELKNDPATFAHEYGHMTDEILLNKLHKDKELKKIFSKEVDAYKLTATGLNEKQILYFTDKKHENKGGCLTEVIAETMMLLSGLQRNQNTILLRAKILQENFPETIAYIGSKFQEVNQ